MNKTQTPKHLEVGMRVKAICMSKLVGDYVVVKTDSYDSRPAAFLAVRGDDSKQIVVVTERKINPENNSVRVLMGQKIQCTDYYYDEVHS